MARAPGARCEAVQIRPRFTGGDVMAKTGAVALESLPDVSPAAACASRADAIAKTWAVVLAGGDGCRL